MKTRIRVLALLVALTFAVLSFPMPAHAASWSSAYLKLLKQSSAKRSVALIDLNADNSPEMAVLSTDAQGNTTLKLYQNGGSGATSIPLSLTDLPVKQVSAASILQRKNAGKPCLVVELATSDTRLQLALYSQNGAIAPVSQLKQVRSGTALKYYSGGKEVTQAVYDKAVADFDASYKKAGTLPSAKIAKSSKSAKITSLFNSLTKAYKVFGTASSVKLSETKVKMTTGKSLQLKATVAPSTAVGDAVTWSSTKPAVADVDQTGKVRALSAGTAKITATTRSGKKQTCKITVKGPTVTGVMLDEAALTMVVGGGFKLTASLLPIGIQATETMKWSSSNPKVASVSQAGEVLAIGKGKCTITVKLKSGKTAKCKVVVNTTPAVIVDISQHNNNGKLDWKLIQQNVDLLILRCGVTRTETNPIGIGRDDSFAYYATKCKEYQIPFGVYFYGKCNSVEMAKQEAEATWQIASPYNPLFYVYDAEESRLNKKRIEAYMTHLKSLGAKKTGYYIAHHMYTKYNLDTSLVDFIWLPHYGQNTGEVNSTPSYTCDLHQYTSRGKIPGLPGNMDVNRLMGRKTLAWFLQR